MKKEPDWFAIYDLIDRRGLKAARGAFLDAAGVSHDDPSLDVEIEQAFLDWVSRPGPLKLDPRLVVALILREGFAGRKQGSHKPLFRKLTHARAMAHYKKLRTKRLTADEAAKETAAKYKMSVDAIRDGRPNRVRPRKEPEAH
jgi:hypothetical protein